MKKHIPNALTCCNLISGVVATLHAFVSDFKSALAFIVLGAVFDFFDGFAARLLHVSSPLGKELDSLADDVTFGVAPAVTVYSLMILYAPTFLGWQSTLFEYLPYVAFLIAAFSALRLAKFNLDERQATSFIGLPTPANALFWASLAVGLEARGIEDSALVTVVLTIGVIVSCWLLVAEIPMFALKFKSYGWKGNELRYSFALVSVALVAWLGLVGFAAVIPLYIICSIASNVLKR